LFVGLLTVFESFRLSAVSADDRFMQMQ